MEKCTWKHGLKRCAFCVGVLGGLAALAQPQEQPAMKSPEASKTAEQQFKNIQVLKNIPADQLMPSMQFITASLGVDCEFCHVEHAMDKDDKKTKLAARKMITMMIAIDQINFEGKREVTCYTCHRGSPHPVSIPILSAESSKPAAHLHEEGDETEGEAAAHGALPSTEQLLDKYLTAVGGANALKKINTRIQEGKIEAFGGQFPIEVYSEAPEKRVSITHLPKGESVTAFNGELGWLSMGGRTMQMTAAEGEAARIDAELYFPARLRELYKEFRVLPGEEISGKQAYLLTVNARGKPSLRLYFDQQTGLLLRLIRYAETPLGRNPTQIDYADYRETGGVKIPYQWTLMRPGGAFTIRIEQVQQNVPVDEKLFLPPAEGPAR